MRKKAQVSLEAIVIIAALLAVAFLVVSRMQQNSKKAAEKIDKKSKDIFDAIDSI